jgi:hypothetical protein
MPKQKDPADMPLFEKLMKAEDESVIEGTFNEPPAA